MLQMTTDVIPALKTNFVSFKEWGIYKIQGENFSYITKQLEAIAVSLNEFDSLPEEAPLGVLN